MRPSIEWVKVKVPVIFNRAVLAFIRGFWVADHDELQKDGLNPSHDRGDQGSSTKFKSEVKIEVSYPPLQHFKIP